MFIVKSSYINNGGRVAIDNIFSSFLNKTRHINSCRRMSIDIGGMRRKYKGKNDTFLETHLTSKDPFAQFKVWFDEACNTPEILEPNAMCLATCTKDCIPSARFVLCKGYGVDGFKFFTNYGSRKAKELEENPRAALTFFWEPLKRCVRIEGKVQKVSEIESDKYFHSRPRDSQFGACASNQSSVIASRDVLVEKEHELRDKYKDDIPIKRPNWGGYLVIPHAIEFWQGQSDRLHDRIKFRKPGPEEELDGEFTHEAADGWVYERLSP